MNTPFFKKNIGSKQNFLARIERVGDVMEAALGAGMIAGIGEVVGFVGRGQPDAGLAAVVHDDALGETEAEIILEEFAAARDIGGKPVPVIDAPHVAAARRETLRLVLQRRFLVRRRVIPFGVVIELDDVAVGILADKGLALAEIAIVPADVETGALQRHGAASRACSERVR